jgi:L-ascorbate metabolism protein UlaG (beta-lactamase superfamily)
MYLLDAGRTTTFFAGDTALSPDTHALVERELHAAGRSLDVALLPIGHAPWWKPGFRRGHLTSQDALELFERLRARYFIPYHWGTFHHVTARAHDAIEVLRGLLPGHPRREHVRIIEPGQRFELPIEEDARGAAADGGVGGGALERT